MLMFTPNISIQTLVVIPRIGQVLPGIKLPCKIPRKTCVKRRKSNLQTTWECELEIQVNHRLRRMTNWLTRLLFTSPPSIYIYAHTYRIYTYIDIETCRNGEIYCHYYYIRERREKGTGGVASQERWHLLDLSPSRCQCFCGVTPTSTLHLHTKLKHALFFLLHIFQRLVDFVTLYTSTVDTMILYILFIIVLMHAKVKTIVLMVC